MKRINHIFYTLGLAATLGTAPAIAQNATEAHPMIVTPHVQKCSYLERTLCLTVQANVDYEVSCDQEWATVRKGETLSEIAARNGTSVKKLRQLNGIKGDRINIGQKLRVK